MITRVEEVTVGLQSRFHDEQIVKTLREQEASGLPVSSFLGIAVCPESRRDLNAGFIGPS